MFAAAIMDARQRLARGSSDGDAKASGWRAGYATELDALFRQRLRVASGLFLVLHVGAFVAVPDASASPAAFQLRVAVGPLVLALLGLSYWPKLGRASRTIAAVFIALIAAYSAWDAALAGRTLETRALMLTILGAGLLFPFSTATMLALSAWVLGLYVLVARSSSDAASRLSGAFFIVGAGALATVTAALSSRLRQREYRARQDLSAAKEETDALIRDMLPEPIVERLKRERGFIADRHADVTVMFVDIAGFTQMSAVLPPDALVRFLNDLFSRLDKLATNHGLEKIKTIGDAYMVAGGLPSPRADHAAAVAEMALDMQAELTSLETPDGNKLRFRIGIHSGPVVAGVIGVTKLSYDLWGDTVNTASRMESHGEPGTIQVSASTHVHLAERYRLAPRGTIEVKGKGAMQTYVLLGRA